MRVFRLLDDEGTVVKRVLHESSGDPGLDDAAARVSGTYRFSPAMNRGRRVPVWISIPIRFEPRGTSPRGDP